MLKLRVDAHVGPTAPRRAAVGYSRRRGLSVAHELASRGVSMQRILIAGWGKAVTRRAASSSHANGEPARMGCGWAELFVQWPISQSVSQFNGQGPVGMIDGLAELPLRPEYYPAAAATMRVHLADDVSDGSELDDAPEPDVYADEPGGSFGDSDGGESNGGPEAADGWSSGSDTAEVAERGWWLDGEGHAGTRGREIEQEGVDEDEDEEAHELRLGLLAGADNDDDDAEP
uniref:Uncharacterized protein n=1 Tax=Haptolina brevifila TaxID=156173 RepID=A0A7S2DFL4_9EUKA|mmetsp:Transcript_37589/g.75212  ORF Transcript_37589/g.75212 Transcript_37589/m.75212 type:complete len:231 (+) Transcript_37589:801-1493(+)